MSELICEGVTTHNLKNISVNFQLGQWIAITGVSGSGKSSLAFDTIYAESQRRFLETLGTYERQFLQGLPQGKFEKIENIPAAIALKQNNKSSDPRSVIATSCDIAEPLRNLFSFIMDSSCAFCGNSTKHHNVQDLTNYFHSEKNHLLLCAKLNVTNELSQKKFFQELLREGFTKIFLSENQKQMIEIEDLLAENTRIQTQNIYIVLDRLDKDIDDLELENRAESAWSLIKYSSKFSEIYSFLDKEKSSKNLIEKIFYVQPYCEVCNKVTTHIQSAHLDWQTTLGACPHCRGLGQVPILDENKIIPNSSLTIEENAIKLWSSETFQWMKNACILECKKRKIPTNISYEKLSKHHQNFIWKGDLSKTSKDFVSIEDFFEVLEQERYKSSSRILLARYRKYVLCQECLGKRLSKIGQNAQCFGKKYTSLFESEIHETLDWILSLEKHPKIFKKINQFLDIYHEVKNKLVLLCDLGLSNAHLFRRTRTLSGGEFQRVLLCRVIGNGLTDALYILDEPSVGLGAFEIPKLIQCLHRLKDLGNTILMVEHDLNLIAAADIVLELGPGGGAAGGFLLHRSEKEELVSAKFSENVKKRLLLESGKQNDFHGSFIEIHNFTALHCKNLNFKIPLEKLTVIAGPSGSGKTTLVSMGIEAALERYFETNKDNNLEENLDEKIGIYEKIILPKNFKEEYDIVFVDQKAGHRSITSTPATLFGCMDYLRKKFFEESKKLKQNYTMSDFSFNGDGGCSECGGKGTVQDDLFFLGQVEKLCQKCEGKRFEPKILEICYLSKNISQWLNLTIDEWLKKMGSLLPNVKPLLLAQKLGLGHLPMGIPTSQVSGGEAGRLRLCAQIGKTKHKIFCILDEPTRGLSEYDIGNLFLCLKELTENGHTIVVVEHHSIFQKHSDYCVTMGPGSGKDGGKIVRCDFTKEKII